MKCFKNVKFSIYSLNYGQGINKISVSKLFWLPFNYNVYRNHVLIVSFYSNGFRLHFYVSYNLYSSVFFKLFFKIDLFPDILTTI